MEDSKFILLLLFVIIAIIFIKLHKKDAVYVKVNDDSYLVQDTESKIKSAKILATIKQNIDTLTEHMYEHKDGKYKEYKPYIDQLANRIRYTKISEASPDSGYTSYSVNKGEEIVFCLRSKKNNSYHDLNILMYVVLHEISHVACPEYGHTQLFKDIFAFFAKVAVEQSLYTKIDFKSTPTEYCGLTITESII